MSMQVINPATGQLVREYEETTPAAVEGMNWMVRFLLFFCIPTFTAKSIYQNQIESLLRK